MISFAKQTAGAVAVVALLAAGVLAPAAQAGSTASPQVVAQAGTTTPTQKMPPSTMRAKKSPVDRVEGRITELRTQLKITDAQATQWNDFAQVMRDNAKTMTAALDKRAEAAKTMTSLDDMRSYLAVTQAHADGMAKLVPAYEKLYSAMTPEQQKNADLVFAKFGQRRHGPRGKMPASAPAKP